MTKFSLRDASVPELVGRFENVARSQDAAILAFRTTTYNRLYKEMDAIREELRSRDGDQRRSLVMLLESDNVHVRLKAAISLLSIFPASARQVLETISKDKTVPQCIDAGSILRGLQDRSFVPD